MEQYRNDVFLACKTGERDAAGARAQLEESLRLLRTDHFDLYQLHAMTTEEDLEVATGPGGALETFVKARDEGLVRHLGFSAHSAELAVELMSRFEFDSVLFPYNFTMLQNPDYAADAHALLAVCAERGVAAQTIKSVARRRWQEDSQPRFSWYEPLRDPEAIRRAVHYVLAHPGVFLNTSSDATILRHTLEAAADTALAPADADMQIDVTALGVEPLFVRGVSDRI